MTIVYRLSPLLMYQLIKFPEIFMRVSWMQQNHAHRYTHDVSLLFKSYILKLHPANKSDHHQYWSGGENALGKACVTLRDSSLKCSIHLNITSPWEIRKTGLSEELLLTRSVTLVLWDREAIRSDLHDQLELTNAGGFWYILCQFTFHFIYPSVK